MSEDTIERLCEALLNTIDEFAEDNRLTTGDAMGALFSVMVSSARASPQYDAKLLVTEVTDRIKEAVGLQ